MGVSRVMQQFLNDAPLTVMTRITLQNVFAPRRLDELFERTAEQQYTRELLFSQVVELMTLVVCRASPSVHAAYQKRKEALGVSHTALYDKLNHLEPNVSRALVRHTATQAGTLIRKLRGQCPPLLPGYRLRHLDGNHLGGTEHRLEVLREVGGGALPGLVLAVLDPEAMVIEDVICCEDGHTQECTLLDPLLETTVPDDLLVADRHYCTSDFLFGLHRRGAFFVIRQHLGHLRWDRRERRRRIGKTATGTVYEQPVVLTHPQTGEPLEVRRVTVKLEQPTRDGDREIHILTNVPSEDADAVLIAELYRERWTVETAFQQLTVHLKCEPNTLGYPRAALLAFCVAVASYNLLAIVIAALRGAFDPQTIEERLSHYYVAEELSSIYPGMMIALPPEQWTAYNDLRTDQLARELKQIATGVDLTRYLKRPRGPKKPRARRPKAPRQHHATARLLTKHNPP